MEKRVVREQGIWVRKSKLKGNLWVEIGERHWDCCYEVINCTLKYLFHPPK